MKTSTRSLIILTGGGTAGHVWPHFALFDAPLESSFCQLALKEQLQVHYIGSYQGMERDLFQQNKRFQHWQYHPIFTGKLRRYRSWRNLLDPFAVIFGLIQSLYWMLKLKPQVVFSKGGFVAAPVVWAAWLCRVPIVIHESDATVALTTRLTAPFAKKIAISFPQTISRFSPSHRRKVVFTGLPLRSTLFQATRKQALSFFQLPEDRKTLLIFGGSLGAVQINQWAFHNIEVLHRQYNVIHLVGKAHEIPTYPHLSNYRQFAFLNQEMPFAYALADAALCRAGASSLFELAAARVPMLLWPLGLQASRGDQLINAQCFVEKGWAQVIVSEDSLLEQIGTMMDHQEALKAALESAPDGVGGALAVGNILVGFL